VTACLFDLDGVLTQTAKVHAAATIDGLGNRKNAIVLKLIQEQGVQPYEGSVRYVEAAVTAGLRRAVVSSSTNCREVLAAAGIQDLFEDALAGVEAGRTGEFGFVVGVDRVGQAAALKAHGADVVVRDLAELLQAL
jgi:beta-phosphoglucomutase-like phosphatase (HAD superfamily)